MKSRSAGIAIALLVLLPAVHAQNTRGWTPDLILKVKRAGPVALTGVRLTARQQNLEALRVFCDDASIRTAGELVTATAAVLERSTRLCGST